MMLIYKYNPEVTTATGAWSGNTLPIAGGLCRQVYLKSASAGTEFDVTITDDLDVVIRRWNDVGGILNDLTPFYMRGIHTIAISADADEAFTLLISINDG